MSSPYGRFACRRLHKACRNGNESATPVKGSGTDSGTVPGSVPDTVPEVVPGSVPEVVPGSVLARRAGAGAGLGAGGGGGCGPRRAVTAQLWAPASLIHSP